MIPTEPPARPARMPLDRRTLMKGGAIGAGLLATPLAARDQARGFTHGIASGEPSANGVLLWTRYVGTDEAGAKLVAQVSDTPGFGGILAEVDGVATPQRDHCAKLRVEGLEPGRWYFYRFIAPDGTMSETGRTRTLPQGPTERWRMAVFSCSNIGFGWFNAYAHAVETNEFDMIAHLGDYYYEYGFGTYPSKEEFQPGRVLEPLSETVTLADYRQRHADYRRDPDLQRVTQLYPMILVWDDHETANDSWQGGAENHQSDTEGEWAVRKAAAIRAYREWLPVSDEPYKAYEIGDLATLFALDSRLFGRDEAPNLGRTVAGKNGPLEIAAALRQFRQNDWRDPAHQMLGEVQEQWLFEGLKTSRRNGKTWQVLAQQVLMGSLNAPQGIADTLPDSVPDYVRDRITLGAAAAKEGLPANLDAWDGYPVARERLLGAAREADADLVVLAGNSHNAWAFNLDHDGERAGVEFAGHSVSSPGFESFLPNLPPETLARELVAINDQLVWANTSQRGYMALELTPRHATSEYRFLSSIREKGAGVVATQRLTTLAGQRKLDMG